MISYEVNIICDAGLDAPALPYGQRSNCEGCFTSEPDNVGDASAAMKQAIKLGWMQVGEKHHCPACADRLALEATSEKESL